MIGKLLCRIVGHKWRRRYFQGSLNGPEAICHRCGEMTFALTAPPKPWPRATEPRITGRAPTRPDRAPTAEWLDPSIYTPPRGTKIQLLTDWGIAVYGHWDDDGFVAWAPLLQKPSWLIARMCQKRVEKAAEHDMEVRHVERNVPNRRATD